MTEARAKAARLRSLLGEEQDCALLSVSMAKSTGWREQ